MPPHSRRKITPNRIFIHHMCHKKAGFLLYEIDFLLAFRLIPTNLKSSIIRSLLLTLDPSPNPRCIIYPGSTFKLSFGELDGDAANLHDKDHIPEVFKKTTTCDMLIVIPSLKLTFSPLKINGWKMNFFLGWPIFTGYVSFRECSDHRSSSQLSQKKSISASNIDCSADTCKSI